jgi:hypothetical protein
MDSIICSFQRRFFLTFWSSILSQGTYEKRLADIDIGAKSKSFARVFVPHDLCSRISTNNVSPRTRMTSGFHYLASKLLSTRRTANHVRQLGFIPGYRSLSTILYQPNKFLSSISIFLYIIRTATQVTPLVGCDREIPSAKFVENDPEEISFIGCKSNAENTATEIRRRGIARCPVEAWTASMEGWTDGHKEALDRRLTVRHPREDVNQYAPWNGSDDGHGVSVQLRFACCFFGLLPPFYAYRVSSSTVSETFSLQKRIEIGPLSFRVSSTLTVPY